MVDVVPYSVLVVGKSILKFDIRIANIYEVSDNHIPIGVIEDAGDLP